jgi:hypothetical protein
VLSVPGLQLRRSPWGCAGAIELAVMLWIGLAPKTARATTHVSVTVLASAEEHTSWAEVGGAALGGLFFLVLFLLGGAALMGVGRTVKEAFDEPSVSYAGRPPHLTHPCDPVQEPQQGARWECPVCGCPWVARQSSRLVSKTYSTGSPPFLYPLERRSEWVTGKLQWVFDRETYERTR